MHDGSGGEHLPRLRLRDVRHPPPGKAGERIGAEGQSAVSGDGAQVEQTALAERLHAQHEGQVRLLAAVLRRLLEVDEHHAGGQSGVQVRLQW